MSEGLTRLIAIHAYFPDRGGDISPDDAADMVLAKACQVDAPVDLQAVVDLWPGLRVDIDTLDGAGYLIDLGARGGEIFLRRQDRPQRRRYTLAHELGHWVLGRQCGGSYTNEHGVQSASVKRVQIERWCDLFAAQLLMPSSWVLRDAAAAYRLGNTCETLSRLPRKYRVSQQAAWIRVAQLTDFSVIRRSAGHPPKIQEFPSHSAGPRQRVALIRKVKELPTPHDDGELSPISVEGLKVFYQRGSVAGSLVAYARPM